MDGWMDQQIDREIDGWIKAMFHAMKSLLYYNDKPKVKKGESNFDVTMGANDEAEVCEF